MKFAIYGRMKEWICDVEANSEQEAFLKAKCEHPEAEIVIPVVPGNDLGVRGL